MASFEQLKELFLNQKEKDGRRREKEKEEEEIRRKEDKEEVKHLVKSHMSTIKEDINEVKMKQNMIEDKVKEAEDKMAKKYDDMANKLANLEIKIEELEARKRAEVEERETTFPALQPAGRTGPDLKPHHEGIHPEGRLQAHFQPTDLQLDKEESNESIYRIVR